MTDRHDDTVKDSWKKYEACMRLIREFLRGIQVQGQEVSLGPDIWLGSPAAPYVRTRLEHDPGSRIAEAIHKVEQLMSAVDDGFQGAIKDANRAIEELKAIPANAEYVERLTQRTEWLQATLEELRMADRQERLRYHPRVLMAWHDILTSVMSPGDAQVRVPVQAVYIY